jgi:hypothetical protein
MDRTFMYRIFMYRTFIYRTLVRLCLYCFVLAPLGLRGQDFKLGGREVQVHGFASQGFVHTDENNWLTMETSNIGSGEFTDVALNASIQVSDNFRLGAQGFDRKLGKLGDWHPSVDWAMADYKFTSWFGLRAGKVKTTLGLYNDTQGLDFLHTFALLPQSMYPTDLRDATVAHIGGDVYGAITLKHHLGDFSYTGYAGHRSDSIYSGYPYLLSQFGTHFTSFGGLQYGGDFRWNTPLRGLLVGASRLDQDTSGKGTSMDPVAGNIIPYSEHSKADWTNQFYGEYAAGKLRIDSEYRRYVRDQIIFSGSSENVDDVRGWYFSGAYRIFKRLELGSYYSHYSITSVYGGALAIEGFPNQTDTSLPANHIYDKVLTARVDIRRFWYMKIEGHFMNGYGSSTYPDGFYPQVNPQGFKPDTNALVLTTGMYF